LLPRTIIFAVGLAAFSASPAVAGVPRSAPPGVVAPHTLPGTTATAAGDASSRWLVGTRLTPGTRALAGRYGAQLLSPRGTYVVPRGQARAFASALKRSGAYRFSEPDTIVRSLQDPPPPPPPYDEFAATDWRGFLLGTGLVPPPVTSAPLTAVIDSAVDTTHPDLQGIRVIGDPAVSDLHGTAVASTITGQANGVGMVGVFPGTPLLSIGSGLATSDLIKAISMALENKAKIINMSWGGPSPNFAMFVEIAYAVSQGVLPVAAAGNDRDAALPDGSTNPVVFPAAFPHVLSVSAIGPSGKSSDFSTANGAVDVSAPGESVLTAVPVALDVTDGVQDGYMRLDGTSFASPIVAGVAAWLETVRPDLSGREVGDILRYSASDVGDKGYDSDTGYGMVNLGAAIAQPRPASDGIEVNDDIEWTNGKRFNKPDPYIYRGFTRRGVATGAVDTWKDPADVFRIQMPRRSRFKVTLRAARGTDPDLGVYSSKGTSIYKRRGLVGLSTKGESKTETMTFTNSSSQKATAYVAVYAPSTKADRYDAEYALTVEKR
jgi:hypothetical protein